jgi:hypothetical protein
MTAASAHAAAHAPVRPAPPLTIPGGIRAMFAIFMVLGVASFVIQIQSGGDPTRAYAAFLLGYVYFLFVSVAGTFFTALHYLVGATWSVVVRRVAEAFSSYLPVALLLFVVLLIGVPKLYVWSNPPVTNPIEAEHVTKGGFLSIPFFTMRNLVILTAWSLFAWYFVRNSTRQDATRDPSLTVRNLRVAPVFVLFFALSLTMVGFDLLMSLEPLWYSTIFGVYCFAGAWQSFLALLAITVVLLRRQGALDGIVNRFHYHDLGKYLFAFSVFWMYIAFSQFMLIWYANLPEETEWLIPRTYTGWGGVGILLMVLKFGIPFFGLLHQKVKESEAGLLTIASIVLIGQWVDLFWIILPSFSPERVVFGWTEIGVSLGFLGLFGWVVTGFLSRHPVAPVGDPSYEPSVRFHG